jgi:hypothetical protein
VSLAQSRLTGQQWDTRPGFALIIRMVCKRKQDQKVARFMSRPVPDLSSDFDAHQFIGDYELGIRPHWLFSCWPFGIKFPSEVIA